MRYHMFLESGKAGSGYAFDKLLHNHCRISDEVLADSRVKFFAVLREPEPTMKSILNMGRLKGETTGFGDEGWVRDYYCARLRQIVAEMEKVPGGVRYLDAEDVRRNTAAVLRGFEHWLGLSGTLSEEYQLFDDSGKPGGRGDWAGEIKSGRVVHSKKDRYNGILLTPSNLEAATATYHECRARLLQIAEDLAPARAPAPETASEVAG